MTTVMILYAIGYGLNIAQIVLVGTKTLTRAEKYNSGHPVKGSDTFEDYCKGEWDFTGNYARRLMLSADVIDNIKTVPIGTVPKTETQVRPLTRLPPEKQAEVWDE